MFNVSIASQIRNESSFEYISLYWYDIVKCKSEIKKGFGKFDLYIFL